MEIFLGRCLMKTSPFINTTPYYGPCGLQVSLRATSFSPSWGFQISSKKISLHVRHPLTQISILTESISFSLTLAFHACWWCLGSMRLILCMVIRPVSWRGSGGGGGWMNPPTLPGVPLTSGFAIIHIHNDRRNKLPGNLSSCIQELFKLAMLASWLQGHPFRTECCNYEH